MRKQTTFMALLLAAAMSLALFMISYQVQDLEDQLDLLNRDIARDGRAVHVLQAEWAHLNDPERLRALADKYLGLTPVGTRQLGQIEDIPWRRSQEFSTQEVSTDPQNKPSVVLKEALANQPTSLAIADGAPKSGSPKDDTIPAIRRALGLMRSEASGNTGGGIIPVGEGRP